MLCIRVTFKKENKSDRWSVHFFTILLYCILCCTVPYSKRALQYDIFNDNEVHCDLFLMPMAISGFKMSLQGTRQERSQTTKIHFDSTLAM